MGLHAFAGATLVFAGTPRDSSRPLKTVSMAKTALAVNPHDLILWYGHTGPPQGEPLLRARAQISHKDDATRGPTGFRSQRDPARSQDGTDRHRGPNELAAQLIERVLADAVSLRELVIDVGRCFDRPNHIEFGGLGDHGGEVPSRKPAVEEDQAGRNAQ